MVSHPCRPGLLLLVSLLGGVSLGVGQETGTAEGPEDESLSDFVGVGVVPKLTIARKDLPDFFTDEGTLTAPGKSGESGGAPPLEGLFRVGADSSRYAFYWDPVSCRLLGAVDLVDPPSPPGPEGIGEDAEDTEDTDASGEVSNVTTDGGEDPPGPFFLAASGPPPLFETAGGGGVPSFFGVRLIEGKPEFLYQQGTLLVAERLWLENGGETLQQQFTFREMDSPLSFRVPGEWRERVTADRGEWEENTLTVPSAEAGELRLTYRLGPTTAEPDNGEEE